MLIDEISELLTARVPSERRPFLDHLDTTLTSGYAHALQLEAARRRRERRLGEVAAGVSTTATGTDKEELSTLAQRLTTTNDDIATLRSLLGSLRSRRASLREVA